MNTSSGRGVVLLLVIVFGLIMSIIGIAAIENSGQQQSANSNLLSEYRAQHIAYAGLELARDYISQCRDAFGTIDYDDDLYRFPEHISANRNPIIVPIPPAFQQQIQSYGSLSVSITPDPGNTTQVLLPATDQNICKSLYGTYTISSTATITSGISGTIDVIKNLSMRMCVQRSGYFGVFYGNFDLSDERADFTLTLLPFNNGYGDLIAGGVRSGTYLKTAELFSEDFTLRGPNIRQPCLAQETFWLPAEPTAQATRSPQQKYIIRQPTHFL
jgi:hypothetical protein